MDGFRNGGGLCDGNHFSSGTSEFDSTTIDTADAQNFEY